MFGVDVQSGDVRGDAPSYALVIFDGETLERDVVSRRKLRRLIDSREPAIVATDNMYELASDKDELVNVLRELPAGTKLVQVTGDERPEPLSRVAKRHGVPYDKQPMAEAEAAARLAAGNVGYEVSAFTDTTEVKVARGRSTGGGGGFSEDRYTRRIHGAVKTTAREVESDLDAAGLDYEKAVTEKYGGYANAVFEVEGRPADIPVSEHRNGDTRIEIERLQRDGIEFRPLAKRRDHVLVGVDPGTTTAVAIVGLEGSVLDVYSTRTDDTAAVTEWIVERGRPVVVAADVTPMPNTVEKLRRSFDAAGWVPDSDLPVDEKQHRTREVPYDNDHERDALAAALSAYDDHEDQIDRIAAKVPPKAEVGPIVADVVAGEHSVESALAAREDDESDDEAGETSHEPRELTPEEKKIRRLEARVERLESHTEDLKDTIASKNDRIDEYERKLERARSEQRTEARKRREVTRLERENDRLQRELEDERERVEDLEGKLERLKALWKLDHSNFADVSEKREGLVPVKIVEKFTTEAIRDADERFGLASGDVIMFRDATGAGRSTAERLADIDPRLVLRQGGLSDASDEVLFEQRVPVADAEEVTVQEVDELAVAREREVDAAIEEWNDWVAERKRERNQQMVDRLISEHRASDRGES
ncbi:putative nuclease of RNase H fold, RuvC/YqgF family [Halapricum desulfuricans]|uniref:Putative nuclease of RNase H fold, RuvC/YqgF family n=1 Tax=Halapricum desulfuricans TaxID=2841257 RepID=A0A897N4D6_9EURY|nr:putative nuclease of RNase H fold, RuvC/YqgF family [Halapricum desulfuricans]